MSKIVSSFIRQALQYSRKTIKIHFQNWIIYIYIKKNIKRKKTWKEKITTRKIIHIWEKIKLTKSNTNVEQKNPTQNKILLSFEYIRKETRHLNLNLIFIIVKYVSIYKRSFKKSKYFIPFFFYKQTYLQSSVKQSKRDNCSQIITKN